MPQTGPQAVPRGAAAEALPGWRRPVLVVSHQGDQCHALGDLLRAVAGTGAEPAILCLAPRSCPSAGSDASSDTSSDTGADTGADTGTGELTPCPSQSPELPAGTVQFRRTSLTDGQRGHPPRGAGHRDLATDVEQTVRTHAGDGVVAVNLGAAADHSLHHRAAQATLQVAGKLGLHALVRPGRSQPVHRVRPGAGRRAGSSS
jgi:hypothetical protein